MRTFSVIEVIEDMNLGHAKIEAIPSPLRGEDQEEGGISSPSPQPSPRRGEGVTG